MSVNWKQTGERGELLVKVVEFPGDGIGGESMWVEVLEGDENDGTGLLRNNPVFSDLKFGDRVKFSGGTDNEKPRYTQEDE